MMPYYSHADVYRLMAEQYDTKSNVELGGFQSQLEASCVSSRNDELWYNETVCLWMTMFGLVCLVLWHRLFNAKSIFM